MIERKFRVVPLRTRLSDCPRLSPFHIVLGKDLYRSYWRQKMGWTKVHLEKSLRQPSSLREYRCSSNPSPLHGIRVGSSPKTSSGLKLEGNKPLGSSPYKRQKRDATSKRREKTHTNVSALFPEKLSPETTVPRGHTQPVQRTDACQSCHHIESRLDSNVAESRSSPWSDDEFYTFGNNENRKEESPTGSCRRTDPPRISQVRNWCIYS